MIKPIALLPWIGIAVLTVLAAPSANAVGTARDLFELSVEELLQIDVTIASRVSSDPARQPASVTTISRAQIAHSGARTLNEVLLTYVPGFFLVEDQDDVIAAFRGFSADNNSKTLLLLNGQQLNTEWFWGPPDAVLNGIDLDYIERIEVIRGPGSATLGQGVLLGAVNIITKSALANRTRVAESVGIDNLHQTTFETSHVGADVSSYLYLGKGEYEGQPIRREGWPAQIFEQGQFIADRGHRLKRSDYNSAVGVLNYHALELNVIYKQQLRDLYNFHRDREEVQQTLGGINVSYAAEVSEQTSLMLRAHYEQDDYDLFSHSGLAMGGTRELRDGIHLHGNFNEWVPNNRLALGLELNRFMSGKRNREGRNFIVNKTSDIDTDLNETHHYVYPQTVTVKSVFAEDFYDVSETMLLFGGLRIDQHPFWGNHVTPRLGAFYQPDNRWLWRLSWQTGFRGAPGIHYSGGFQRDGFLRQDNFGKVEENTTLADMGFTNIAGTEPETLDNIELALRYSPKKTLTLDSVLFYNVVKNIIDVGVLYVDPAQADITNEYIGSDSGGTWNGFWYYKNNAGVIRQLGTEISLNQSLGKVDYAVSHAYVAVVHAESGQSMYITGDPGNPHFKAYPENVTRLNLQWQTASQWKLFYNHLMYWEWWSTRGSRTDGGNIATAGVDWDISRRVHSAFQIKNVWNEDNLYPMNNNGGGRSDGTPAIESRTFWLRVQYDFE